MALVAVETRTKAEAAYGAIRDAIRSGRLAPGHRLVLRDVARDLGMSFTPVREALRILASQGLVEQQTHTGSVVARFTRERAREVYRLRLLLEPEAARLAAEQAQDEDVAAARVALQELHRALEAERYSELPSLNAAFHHAIYVACGSAYLLEFIDRLWNGLPYQAISLAARAQESHGEHQAILAAFETRDPARCAELVARHIAGGAAAILEVQDSG